MTVEVEGWNFTVVGCDPHDYPRYLGFTQTHDEAVTLQKNMEAAGWRRVAIFDAALQEQIATLQKQVAQKDKQLEQWEQLLKSQQGLGRGHG